MAAGTRSVDSQRIRHAAGSAASDDWADGPLQRNLRAAVADIRTLVDELRPPALELGLMTAVKERAAELGQLVDVRVDGPDSLPTLPAAVEVAAYRICQEALMNVLKHADARHVVYASGPVTC